MGKIYDSLMTEFEEKEKPLRLEQSAIEKEMEGYLFKSDREGKQLNAKLKIFDQEILQLTSEGKFPAIEEKESEKRKIEGVIHVIEGERKDKISVFENRVASIQAQRERIPDQVKNDRLYRLRPESHALIEALLDTLDGYAEDINQFCLKTGSQHLTMSQKQLLGLSPSGPTKILWERLRGWMTGW